MTDARSLVRLVLVLVVLVGLAPLVLHVGATVAPATGSYAVTSNSMAPGLPAGSLVVVYDSGEYTAGDVVTFVTDGGRVTHRIVDEGERGYVTKGDANDAPDGWRVPEAAIVGKQVLAIPWYGTVLARGRSVSNLLVAVTGSLLLVREVGALWQRLL